VDEQEPQWIQVTCGEWIIKKYHHLELGCRIWNWLNIINSSYLGPLDISGECTTPSHVSNLLNASSAASYLWSNLVETSSFQKSLLAIYGRHHYFQFTVEVVISGLQWVLVVVIISSSLWASMVVIISSSWWVLLFPIHSGYHYFQFAVSVGGHYFWFAVGVDGSHCFQFMVGAIVSSSRQESLFTVSSGVSDSHYFQFTVGVGGSHCFQFMAGVIISSLQWF
jgi:hypothetical protein